MRNKRGRQPDEPTEGQHKYRTTTSEAKKDVLNATLEGMEAAQKSRNLPVRPWYSTANIVAQSRRYDPTGQGVSPTYWSNRYPDNQARVYALRGWQAKIRVRTFEVSVAGLRIGRDLHAAWRRYLRGWTKADLAERIVGLEQRVLSLEQRLTNHDEAVIERFLSSRATEEAPLSRLLELMERVGREVKARLNTPSEME